jgi:hypothetical protein
MRRIAPCILALILSGCGYATWWNPSFSGGYDPNLPISDSENMRRVRGLEPSAPPLVTEPGDIWPGPLASAPTLKDLELTGGVTSEPEAPVPGSPLSRRVVGPHSASSSSDDDSMSPKVTQSSISTQPPALPLSGLAPPPAPVLAHEPSAGVTEPPNGLTITTRGGPGYETKITPTHGQSIVVPNGNGTSTVIHSDGQIETIPTPH